MPIDQTKALRMVDVARLSTAQLERISQAVFGTALSEMSNASLPAEQAKDMIAYALQYGGLDKLIDALINVSSGKLGVQNLLLGNEDMVNQTPESSHHDARIDLVRLEDRVARHSDKFDALAVKVETLAVKVEALAVRVEALTIKVEALVIRVEALATKLDTVLHRAPLNWNIVGWGIMLAVLGGMTLWLIGVVN